MSDDQPTKKAESAVPVASTVVPSEQNVEKDKGKQIMETPGVTNLVSSDDDYGWKLNTKKTREVS